MPKLLLKGCALFREDGTLYAHVRGWRPKSGRRSEDYRNSGYTIHYADGVKDGTFTFFRDAVQAARQHHARTGSLS